jgi:hypothetical protein
MKCKRYNISLIEIIIATSLFAILIFSTTSLFFNYNKLKVRVENIRPTIINQSLFYKKTLEMTSTCTIASINKEASSYSEAITFSFDNGYKDDHRFSGKCTCHLFRNFDKQIIYEITNKDHQKISRCLLTDVYKFEPNVTDNTLFITLTFGDKKRLSYAFLLPHTGKTGAAQ